MRRRLESITAGLALVVLLAAAPVAADDYDATEAGNPLRLAAYLLHPVGVLLDVLILRPAHWLASQPVIAELVGHDTDS